jgi:hypothetical protein
MHVLVLLHLTEGYGWQKGLSGPDDSWSEEQLLTANHALCHPQKIL